MNGAQIPLDGAEGQPALFPQSRHQAEQIDAQPLLPQRHARQVRWRHPSLLTYWADSGDIDVLGDLRRSHRQVNDFPGSLHPTASQTGTTLRTGFQDVLHLVGGSHTLAREAVGPGLPGPFLRPFLRPFLPGGPLARFGLDAGHSPQAARLGLSFQALNPPLQLGDGVLLLGNDRQQGFPGGGVQVRVRVHAVGLP